MLLHAHIWKCLALHVSFLCVCVAHTCLYVQRKWLTVKNVTNSNFNCQWKKRTQYLWVLSRWTEEKGLSMKAYSLSQLKSALTWLQPFEVRLAVILERSAPASNNGNWMVEKELFNRAKGNASLSLSLFFLASCYILIDFFSRVEPVIFSFSFQHENYFTSAWKNMLAVLPRDLIEGTKEGK